MEGLLISIDWAYFLGIVGVLIGLAWYGGVKFTRLETLMETLDRRVSNLEGNRQGSTVQRSPLQLSEKGMLQLTESGFKDYIDENKDRLMAHCIESVESHTAYDIQEEAIRYLSKLVVEKDLHYQMKNAAYNNGVTLELMRMMGGLYLRDLCLRKLGIEPGQKVDTKSALGKSSITD